MVVVQLEDITIYYIHFASFQVVGYKKQPKACRLVGYTMLHDAGVTYQRLKECEMHTIKGKDV